MKVLMLIVLSSLVVNAQHLDKVSLQLKWKYQFQFAGFIMAKEKGIYKKYGLDVELRELEESMDVVSEVLDKKSTYGVVQPSVLLDIAQGKELILLKSIYQLSPICLIAIDQGIHTIEDFTNKKIMTGGRQLDASLVSMMLSHKVDIQTMTLQKPSFTLSDLIEGKTDLVVAYTSNEPFELKKRAINHKIFSPKDYGFSFYGDMLMTSKEHSEQNPLEVQRFIDASMEGWKYAFNYINESVDIIFNHYNTQNKTKAALLYEAVELKKLAYLKKIPLGDINVQKLHRIYDVYNLLGLVKNHKVNFNDYLFKSHKIKKTPLLSPYEQAYLEQKGSIKVCYDKSFAPLTYTEKGKAKGMVVSILDLIEQKIGLKFSYVEANNWVEQYQKLQEGLCDIVAVTSKNPNHYDFLTPSTSYQSNSFVLITDTDEPYQEDLKQLKNKTIAIKYGFHTLHKYLETLYPNIKFIQLKENGFEKVARGEIYGYASISYHVSKKIAQEYRGELKIMGKLINHKIEGSFGVNKNDDTLLAILNQAIETISIEEKEKIFKDWYDIEIDREIDYTIILHIIIGFIIIFIIIIIAYIKQKRLKSKIENMNHSLQEKVAQEVAKNRAKEMMLLKQSRLAQMGEMIAMIAHQWRQPLNNLSLITQTITLKYHKDSLDEHSMELFDKKSSKYIQQMSQTIDDFRNFFKTEYRDEWFSINDAIKESFELIEASYQAQYIRAILKCENRYYLKGNSSQFGQALLNILNNARDALIINNVEKKMIQIELRDIDGYVVLAISDNALGIKKSIKDRVFDPYFSTKLDKNGTGLGLYMTKAIIEDHFHGEIHIVDIPHGTKFELIFKIGQDGCRKDIV